jgi:cell division protein DivIC
MKKFLHFFKNKFILTTTIFILYILFLDDVDIFTIINQNMKHYHLKKSKNEVAMKLRKTQYKLRQLRYTPQLEDYARETKLFKRNNEDIFIISYE